MKRIQGLVEANQEETVSEQLLLLSCRLAEALQWMTQAMPIAFVFMLRKEQNEAVWMATLVLS